MAEQPINSDEIIDKGLFTSFFKEADELIAKDKEIIAQNKKLLESFKDIANANIGTDSKALIKQADNAKKAEASIKDLNTAETNLINTEKAKVQLKQEEVKLQKLLDAENRRQIKTLNELNGEYKKGTQDLNRLKKELKELEFTGRTNGKLYKALSNEFNTLDAKVRKAEGSVKEFQRNVGNYPKTLDSIAGKLAGAFSVGAIINFGKKILDTRAEFQKFEAVLTNTLGSNSAANRALNRIQDLASKTPFSVKELTESFVKLANQGFKPTNAELTKLGDLAASQGKSFDQLTEGIIDATTGEFERLKEFGIRAEKQGDKVKFTFKGVQTQTDFNAESIRKYVLGLGDLEGVSGGMAAIADTLGGKISNLGDNFDTLFNLLGKSGEGIMSGILDSFNSFLGTTNELQKSLNKVEDSLRAVNKEQSLGEKLKGETKYLVEYQLGLDAIGSSSLTNVQKLFLYKKQVTALSKSYSDGKISITEYEKSLILLGNSSTELNETIKEGAIVKKVDTDATKEQIKLAKELAKANKDLDNQLIKLRIDNTELNQRREEDNIKNENRLAKESLAESKGSSKTKLAIEINLDEKMRQELAKVKDKYDKEAKDKKDKEESDAKAEAEKKEKDFTDGLDKQFELNQIAIAKNDEELNKELEKRRLAREKELKEAIEFSKQILDLVSKEVAEKSRIKQEGIDKEISDTQQNIETQRNLAQRGLKNTLAEEEARKIQLERQKEEEKIKEIKRQKALAFFKLFASYAEKDPNTALQKALKDTIIAEAVSAAFQSDGKYIEGTENVARDLQGHKIHNKKDGYLINVDGDERIINPDQNKMIGNLSNEALADLAYKHNNGLLDTVKYGVIQSNDFGSNIANSALLMETMALRKEMQDVKQAIINKPVTNFAFDQYGDFIKETIEGGFSKKTTFKQNKIRL